MTYPNKHQRYYNLALKEMRKRFIWNNIYGNIFRYKMPLRISTKIIESTIEDNNYFNSSVGPKIHQVTYKYKITYSYKVLLINNTAMRRYKSSMKWPSSTLYWDTQTTLSINNSSFTTTGLCQSLKLRSCLRENWWLMI